jgi:hypothetical protein
VTLKLWAIKVKYLILDWQVNPLLIYNPIESDRKMRTGAEEEYSNRE